MRRCNICGNELGHTFTCLANHPDPAPDIDLHNDKLVEDARDIEAEIKARLEEG